MAQSYVDSQLRVVAPGGKLSNLALNSAQATGLKLALDTDMKSYLYSGVVSIGDATQAIDRSLYTWATVKLYYAVFYLARAMLAVNGTAVFYDGTKPFSWNCSAGAMPVKRNGPTHKAVLSTFSAVLPSNPLLSQPIDSIDAMDWMMKLRESANYMNARFCEPNAPKHFEVIARSGVRQSVAAYVNDKTYLYTFDPQHAMIALPIEALKQVLNQHAKSKTGNALNVDEFRYLASLYFDKSGPLPDMLALLNAQ